MEFSVLEELQLPLYNLRKADIVIGEQYGYCLLRFLRCLFVHRVMRKVKQLWISCNEKAQARSPQAST
jgi:hypothetical protein